MIKCIMPSGDHMIHKDYVWRQICFREKIGIFADIRFGEHNCYLQIHQLVGECNHIVHVTLTVQTYNTQAISTVFTRPNHKTITTIGRTSYDVQFIIVLSI